MPLRLSKLRSEGRRLSVRFRSSPLSVFPSFRWLQTDSRLFLFPRRFRLLRILKTRPRKISSGLLRENDASEILPHAKALRPPHRTVTIAASVLICRAVPGTWGILQFAFLTPTSHRRQLSVSSRA